ncbi:MAG: transposase [Desulfuromonadaceae bacterium]|nr:transposase [Desulfuromonadaceae bacterium]
MSRPLRIEYPGAWYHVMNRGRRREDICQDEEDYLLFLNVLQDTAKMWNLNVSAYCLVSNHYHLLVQTPDGNLSRCMRHLNGVYTQRYNRRHSTDGQLFRGRHKAVLVEEDSHLLELLRYIHRNPIEACIVSELEAYKWSSHLGYLADERRWQWLQREPLLNMFSSTRKTAFINYLSFVNQQDSEEVQQFFSRKNLPSIFGSEGFIKKVRNRCEFLLKDKEIAGREVFAVDATAVIKAVCEVCQVTEEELTTARRGVTNLSRDLAVYTLRAHSQRTLAEIGNVIGCENYSTVSSAIERMKKALDSEAKVQKLYKKICSKLKIGQRQT